MRRLLDFLIGPRTYTCGCGEGSFRNEDALARHVRRHEDLPKRWWAER